MKTYTISACTIYENVYDFSEIVYGFGRSHKKVYDFAKTYTFYSVVKKGIRFPEIVYDFP